jgi:NADPH2:quinone reductase
VDPGILATKGSLFLTRPSLAHYLLDREELLQRAKDIFSWAGSGKLQMFFEKPLPLSEATEVHRRLESRKTKGKLILFP